MAYLRRQTPAGSFGDPALGAHVSPAVQPTPPPHASPSPTGAAPDDDAADAPGGGGEGGVASEAFETPTGVSGSLAHAAERRIAAKRTVVRMPRT